MIHKWMKRIEILLTMIFCMTYLTGCSLLYTTYKYETSEKVSVQQADAENGAEIEEDGEYTSKDDVALYIHIYGKLPQNYITKKEAKKLGWEGGELESCAPGKSIGGDHFGNYEGSLPEKKGRSYTECDIDTKGKKRGAKRIVFSNDGLIYYTEDHYETFTLLYGKEE
ncbi:MAG: ribonuclease domain-containing protein [Eubacteriales bacterium]|nr:ribonuclease domain-containing protein [Eubacteriales bacterium]